MTEAETRLLAALAWMAEQYLKDGERLDSVAMSAGQRALEELARYGLVEADASFRGGVWTEAGQRFLDAN